jgi:hypothetical protein
MALETPRSFHAGFDLSRIGALRWRGALVIAACSPARSSRTTCEIYSTACGRFWATRGRAKWLKMDALRAVRRIAAAES